MRKLLAAWLALALSADPLSAAQTARAVERVSLPAPALSLQTPGADPSPAKTDGVPVEPALAPLRMPCGRHPEAT